MTPLVIIGAGGFGRESHDIVIAMNRQEPQWDFLGFIDDQEPPTDLLARRDASWLGPSSRLGEYSAAAYVVAIADPDFRERLSRRAESAGLAAATLIHPSATFGLDVEVGGGTIVCSHVSITTNVRIGRHVHIDQNVSVGHDATLEDYSRVNPGSAISGAVQVGTRATVGTGAVILQGTTVGESSMVGAGAVVLDDVEAGSTVVGVPARRLR